MECCCVLLLFLPACMHACLLLGLHTPLPVCRLLVTGPAPRSTCGCRAVRWHWHRSQQS